MPKYNICIVPEGQSSCDEMLPSSGFFGRGYSTAEDEAQVRSNYQKLVDKGKIESVGLADEIIVKKHPIKNSQGEKTFQWRIFPSHVQNTSDYSQKDSERQKSNDLEKKTAELETCHSNLEEKTTELQTKNEELEKCHQDLQVEQSIADRLTQQLKEQAEGITTKSNIIEVIKSPEELEEIKSRTDPSKSLRSIPSEGGRRKKTKKYGKKRKSTRKKYTKRRKYSRRSR